MILGKIFSRGQTLEGAQKTNSLHLTSNVCLSIALLLCVVKIFDQRSTTVLVPPNLDRAVTVGWNTADGEYIKSFGLYVATLAGNITPKNATFVVDALSTIVSPRIYSDVRVRLRAQAESKGFKSDAGATHFTGERLIYEPENKRLFVVGSMTTDGAGNGARPEPWTYEMIIVMAEGKPMVDAITNYAGSQPHTEAYKKAHPEEVKKAEAQN